MSIEETTKIFDLNNVVRSHATFDPAKLHWLNGEYARDWRRGISPSRSRCIEIGGRRLKNFPQIMSGPHSKLARARSTRLMSCRPIAVSTLSMRSVAIPKGWQNISAENNRVCKRCAMPWQGWKNFEATEIETTFKATAAKLGVKVGALVHPTRLAVTGSNAGPSLYHLLEVLGKEKVLARIDRASGLF